MAVLRALRAAMDEPSQVLCCTFAETARNNSSADGNKK